MWRAIRKARFRILVRPISKSHRASRIYKIDRNSTSNKSHILIYTALSMHQKMAELIKFKMLSQQMAQPILVFKKILKYLTSPIFHIADTYMVSSLSKFREDHYFIQKVEIFFSFVEFLYGVWPGSKLDVRFSWSQINRSIQIVIILIKNIDCS